MHSTKTDPALLMQRLEAVTRKAGDIALAYFHPDQRTSAEIRYKNGGSPVTDADLAVDLSLIHI